MSSANSGGRAVSAIIPAIIGLLLAVPIIVCAKIVLGKIEGLEGWAKVLE